MIEWSDGPFKHYQWGAFRVCHVNSRKYLGVPFKHNSVGFSKFVMQTLVNGLMYQMTTALVGLTQAHLNY